MSRLNPKKLSVTFKKGVNPKGPIIPRRYTLTHSDRTGELFLTIGPKYSYNELNCKRDEVLGEWIKQGTKYSFHVNLHVDSPLGSNSTFIRNSIFERELPLALEAIRYGDRKFFNVNPKLDKAPIIVHFKSINPYFNRKEYFGTFSKYHIKNTSKMRAVNSSLKNKYLLNVKYGDVNGDGIKDKVSLYGNKPDGPNGIFTDNIVLVIQDGKTNFVYIIPLEYNSGYNPTIFLGDFTSDKINDILISIDSGGSGGYTFYYIYSFVKNIPKKLFDFNRFNNYLPYDVTYKNYYKVSVINKISKKEFIIDISNKDKSYLTEIYNKDGTLKKPISGNVSVLSGLYPIDFDRNGVYDLYAMQRITGLYNADGLGVLQTHLVWNGKNFVPMDSTQLVGIYGYDIINSKSKKK